MNKMQLAVKEQVHQGIGEEELIEGQKQYMSYRVKKRKFEKNKGSTNKRQSFFCYCCEWYHV